MDATELEVRHWSDKAFTKHVVKEIARDGVVRCWRCGDPTTGIYAFWITTHPGTITVTGDIGDLIVERHYDMLPWCRGSADSTSYFAEKVPHAIPTKTFSRDKCRAWIDENLNELRSKEWGEHARDEKMRDRFIEVLEEALDDLEAEDYGDQHMYHVTSEVWQGNDPPDFEEWNSNFLWCRDAIRWFVTHHSEEEIKRPDLSHSLPQ